MSIAKALTNAVTGLTATARGTETVAANLANVMTPGYARREMQVSPQTLGGAGGGVRIDGITRVINAGLLAEMRSAGSAKAQAGVRLDFMQKAEDLVGLPGDAGGLGSRLANFSSALIEAGARPDDEIRLANVLSSAQTLVSSLNKASDQVQTMRMDAERSIAKSVADLNAGLERVAYLNKRISIISSEGNDPSSLQDERQAVIDQISAIVPVQEIAREGGKVALFTAEGAVLLDGSQPTKFSFTPVAHISPGQTVANSSMTRLVVDGTELSASQMRLFAGGTLEGNFQVRDEWAPQLQQELNSLALELHDKFANSTVDPTLGATDPGLFTDSGLRANGTDPTGLSARIEVNSSVDPKQGGGLWRIRSGANAIPPGAALGDSAQIIRFSDALNSVQAPPTASAFAGSSSLAQRVAELELRVSTRRIDAESDSTIRNARAETITGRFMADGVDSDAEMQKLLRYEQAYAANARVIQAIEDMMDQILRL